MLKYKDYEIIYKPKSKLGDGFESASFDFIHREYDGREDGRIGSCRTVKECMNCIDQLELVDQHGNTLSLVMITIILLSLTFFILWG